MTGRPRLLVNAGELLRQPGSRRDISAEATLEDLDVHDARLAGPVTLDLHAESTLDHIAVTGEMRVGWSDACRRCLRPLDDTLVVIVDERYAETDATGMRAVDPEAFPIEHGQLDLAPMAREELLLGVPDAPLCRDDCPGLCPLCGADLQTGPCACDTAVRDERWAALDALRDVGTD